MRTIAILALFLVASCDTTIIKECPRKVTVSPLQPVKFWPVDCQTYNEKEVCGINPKCWCQPFECDDPIQAQFLDDPGSFVLKVFGEDDEEITSIDFDSVADDDSEGAPIVFDLSSFANEDIIGVPGAIAWTLGSGPSINLTPGQTSKRLKKSVALAAGTYKIRYSASISPSINSANSVFEPLHFLNGSDVEIESVPITNGVHDVEVTLPSDAASMHFRFVSGDAGNGTAKINRLKFIPIGFSQIYSASFIPSEEGICDQKIKLGIYRTEGNLIELNSLASWINKNTGGTAWTTGSSTPSINIPGLDITDELSTTAVAVGSGAGNYSFDYDLTATVLSAGMYMFVKCYKSGVSIGTQTVFIVSNSQAGSVLVACSDEPDEVTIKIFHDGPGATLVTINNFEPSPEVQVYKSDCLDIREHHDCTGMIQYKNNRNYNGLAFNQGSPDTTFNIRIPMVFFHERGQEEDLVSEDNQQTIHLSGKDVEQRRMDTDYMPYYMHHRLRKILKMQTIFIDETFWTKEASYDIQEGRKDYPLKRAECWLTKKTSIVRSIL